VVSTALDERVLHIDSLAKYAEARSTGRCNTFWSNVGPGGKVGESETKMRVISCTKNVVVAEMERW
jgi:transposase